MLGRSIREISCVLVSISCFFLLIVTGCSSSLELTSGWANQKLTITGEGSHWRNATTEISGPGVSIGVKNDNDHLYIGLMTSNPETQLQMLALGCTVWFDKGENKNKIFGIQFPVSGLLQGRRYPARVTLEEIQRLIAAAQQQLVILGPVPGERRRGPAKNATGLEGRLGFADGILTCELKVPLQKTKTQPYAIDTDVTKPLAVGLETGDFADALKGQTGASSPSQSSGGRGRGGGGRTGGANDQGFSDRPTPLKHWITIHLSSGPTVK
jgi:hypothetical protein